MQQIPLNPKSPTILLVEDDKMVATLCQAMLAALGYDVLLALEGGIGIDLLKKTTNDIDLVILDLMLPDMSTDVALDEIKKIRPAVPVVLTSGYDEETVEKRLGRKCAGFIQKPFKLEELSLRLQEVFD